MLEHADAYDAFEEMMNYESDEGYRLVMTTAMKLLPKFAKAAAKQMSTRGAIDVDAVIAQCSGSSLAQTIIAKFDKNTPDANATLPAMICWLYFGRSFENMVERGEELSKHPKLVGIEKFFLARMMKMVVNKSIELELRTREDWDDYYELKKIIEEGRAVDWALQNDDENNRPPQPLDKAEQPSTLESLILLDEDTKPILLDKIKQYIHSGVKGKRIALMILALRQPRLPVRHNLLAPIVRRIEIAIRNIYRFGQKHLCLSRRQSCLAIRRLTTTVLPPNFSR